MTEKKERLLFYATSSTHVDSICANNFVWTYDGAQTKKYGQGLYMLSLRCVCNHFVFVSMFGIQ